MEAESIDRWVAMMRMESNSFLRNLLMGTVSGDAFSSRCPSRH